MVASRLFEDHYFVGMNFFKLFYLLEKYLVMNRFIRQIITMT